MHRAEANKILERQIEELKTWPYATFAEWQQRKHFAIFEIKGESGNYYRVEAQAQFAGSNMTNNNIRVSASIDDSHLLTVNTGPPLTKSFVMTLSSEIVAE